MITAAGFVVAAAASAVVRWGLALRLNRAQALPYGTMVVNVTGAFLLGLATTWDAPLLTVAGVGVLGTYTTFSTFALELVDASERRAWRVVGTNLAISIVAGVGAALVAIELVS